MCQYICPVATAPFAIWMDEEAARGFRRLKLDNPHSTISRSVRLREGQGKPI